MTWPWALLVGYALVLYLVSPTTRIDDEAGFFEGAHADGRQVGAWALTASVLITWIFAKSITNAANLGATFGLVGGVAYATYWLGIPFAGWVLGAIRRATGARTLVGFLVGRFGQAAGGAFLLAILIRLYNEVWSNTLVVGTYFGTKGSMGFYLAVAVFTGATLAYALKGGLRSSIVTDAVQAGLTAFLVAIVLFAVVPRTGVSTVTTSGDWTLVGGVDLLLVALLQVFSYPFHDPVLTDRAFIAPVPTVRRAFAWAGGLGGAVIVISSLLGIYAFLEQLPVMEDAPRIVGQAFGAGTLIAVNVLMMASAGSTIDSALSSVARLTVADAPAVSPRFDRLIASARRIRVGRLAMVVGVVLGSVPLLLDATILQATTISGTMVLGLAPIICLFWLGPAPPASFHLAFWGGIAVGVALVVGWWPAWLSIGDGAYADLLGANVYGLGLVTVAYVFPWALATRRSGTGRAGSPRTGAARESARSPAAFPPRG